MLAARQPPLTRVSEQRPARISRRECRALVKQARIAAALFRARLDQENVAARLLPYFRALLLLRLSQAIAPTPDAARPHE
jgi:hypothetical protein